MYYTLYDSLRKLTKTRQRLKTKAKKTSDEWRSPQWRRSQAPSQDAKEALAEEHDADVPHAQPHDRKNT